MSAQRGDRARSALSRRAGPGEPSLAIIASVAALWALVLARAAAEPSASIRSIAFAGAPLLLLAGLHARLAGYLHARERLDLLPLPIAPPIHFDRAWRHHRRGLTLTLVAGLAALVIALGWPAAEGPALDFLWLCALAAVIEPVIPAVAAALGRRFPPSTPAAELQRALSGGWTAPEATVHLYAPALGVGLAAALAMPGQLAVERFGVGLDALPWLAAPAVLAGLLRALAPRLYAGGLWEATPRLHEAMRSLSGPAAVDPPPSFVAMTAPALRLDLLQWLRLRPLPIARGLALIAWTAVIALRDAAPSAPHLAVGLALAGLWAASWAAITGDRRRRARLFAALPVAAAARRGALSRHALVIAAAVPLAFLAVFLARVGPLGVL